MPAVSINVSGKRLAALALILSTSACTTGEASESGQSRDVAMFRGNAARTGVYPASGGTSLVGLQWRFMTEGDVVSSPAVHGSTVYVGSGDGRLYALELETGARSMDIEYRIHHPDSSLRYVHHIAHTTLNNEGRPLRQVGTIHDIAFEDSPARVRGGAGALPAARVSGALARRSDRRTD